MGLIMRIARDNRCLAIVLLTVVAVPGISFPSIAQAGFFDFLFGPPPQTQAVRPYEAYPGHFRRHADPSFHRQPHNFTAHRKPVIVDRTDHKVGPQAPIDIMDDDSLQHGDAVMTQAGIRIFVGDSSDHHQPEEFRKISEIKKLSQRERKALAALDAPGANPGGQTAGQSDMVTGRSATEHNVTTGETITDPNGRTVRFVGP
jgi:hypothetical protein